MASSLWQHPFVDVLKHLAAARMETSQRGDVDQVIDKCIRKNVYRLRGKIAASNYLRIPKDMPSKGGLNLTGRFVYLELRRHQGDSVSFNFEILTKKKTSLRVSFSTMYTNTRSMGANLRVPLVLTDKWTVLALDMFQLLDLHTSVSYNREGYEALKTILLCSSMNVRGIYTSDIIYLPETLPKVMQFPLVKPQDGSLGSNSWDDVYDWRWFPQLPDALPNQREIIYNELASLVEDREEAFDAVRPPSLPHEDNQLSHTESAHQIIHSSVKSPLHSPTMSPNSRKQPIHDLSQKNVREAQMQEHRLKVLGQADSILERAGLHRPPTGKDYTFSKYDNEIEDQTDTKVLYYSPTKYGPRICPHANLIWPERIMKLDRIIGFSLKCQDGSLWANNTATSCVYACDSTLVIANYGDTSKKGDSTTSSSTVNLNENFLFGHTQDICALVYSQATEIIASAQECMETTSNLIRFWSIPKKSSIASVKAHPNGVSMLTFSTNGMLLCAVGKDGYHRTQLLVFDLSNLICTLSSTHDHQETHPQNHLPLVQVVAKQVCDFPIVRLKFSPYEPERLVSCGRENIRFWRIKAGHLPGCPVVLHEYARNNTFTDLDFDPVMPSPQQSRSLYVSSMLGTLLVIDYQSMALQCVYKLHDAGIHCMRVNEGFCITGSQDGFLRVWPLDFSDFFLEAQHEAPVMTLDISMDGMQALIGCANGTLGTLNISSQDYTTLIRAHTKSISAFALTPDDKSIVSASTDHTIRVWDVSTGSQTYEFKTESSVATCVSCHPHEERVAVGFASGMLRIFDIPSTVILETYQQHAGMVLDVQYGKSACYTSGNDKQLCCYQRHNSSTVYTVYGTFLPTQGHFRLHAPLRCLAIGGKDGMSIDILDMYSLRMKRSLQYFDAKQKPTALTLVGFVNNNVVGLQLLNQRLLAFSTESGKVVQTWTSLCDGTMGGLAFSPFGRYAFTGRVDQSNLKVLLLEHHQQLRLTQSFVGQSKGVQQVAVASNGKVIVSCGASGALQIWKFYGYEEDLHREKAFSDEDRNNFDESALYDVHRQLGDGDDEESLPSANVPKPIEPPLKGSIVKKVVSLQPLAASSTEWLLEPTKTLGFNLTAQPTVVWALKHQLVMYACGNKVLVDDIQTGTQKSMEQHSGSVLGLVVAPTQARAISWDDSSRIMIWALEPHSCLLESTLDYFVTKEIHSVVFDDKAMFLWCIVSDSSREGSSLLAVVDLQKGRIEAQTSVSSTTRQLAWLGQGQTTTVATTTPMQGWKWDHSCASLISIPFSGDSDASLIATPYRFPVIAAWRKRSHVVDFCSFESHSVLCTAKLVHHKRHEIRTMSWCSDQLLIIATKTSPCLWIYRLSMVNGQPDWTAMKTSGVTLHKIITSNKLEMHTLRLDAPICSSSWYDGKGLVVTQSGTAWCIEPYSFSKRIFERVHPSNVTAIASARNHVVTISGSCLRLFDDTSLIEKSQFDCIKGVICSCVDVSSVYGCVVGYQDGSLRIFKVENASLNLVHQCFPWTMEHEGRVKPTKKLIDASIDMIQFIANCATVIIGNSSGQMLLLTLTTMQVQWIALPFGAHEQNVLSSQNEKEKMGGRLLSFYGQSKDIVLVTWASRSEKSYVHVYTNASNANDAYAWKLPNISPSNACAVFSPVESTVVFYPTTYGIEGRCIVKREVVLKYSLETIPHRMQMYDNRYMLCQSDHSLFVFDMNDKCVIRVKTEALSSAMVEQLCKVNRDLYITTENRLIRLEIKILT